MNTGSDQNSLNPNTSLTKVTNEMKTYAIHWKCSETGRIGTGTMRFDKEEAERLAVELNEKFPNIDHEAVIPAPSSPEPAAVEPVQTLIA